MSATGRLTAEEIAQARSRFDIIAVDVALKKAGSEWKGLCPFHNEKTPSFFVAPNKGFWHCFGCGAHGTPIDYLMRTRNVGFVDAVHELLGARTIKPLLVQKQVAAHKEDGETVARIARIIRESTPIDQTTAAWLYLHTRYLRTRQPGLLAHPALECWELGRDAGGDVRTLPALIAPFTDSANRITAIQRIWLSSTAVFGDPDRPHDNRAPLKTRKKMLGQLGDGAVRLTPLEQVHDELGLAEGIESAESARHLYRVPVWAVGGTARLGYPGHWRQTGVAPGAGVVWIPPDVPPRGVTATWVKERPPSVWIPDTVERLIIFGDRGFAGETSARYAASYWQLQGLTAVAIFPPDPYSDHNDYLIAAVDRREIVVRP